MSKKVRIRSFDELPPSDHIRPHADYLIISEKFSGVVPLQRLKPHRGSNGHSHPWAEKFIVYSGTLTFIWRKEDGVLRWEKVPRRSVIYVPPDVFHAVRNDTDEIVETILFIDKGHKTK